MTVGTLPCQSRKIVLSPVANVWSVAEPISSFSAGGCHP